jgi:hypothetical protein
VTLHVIDVNNGLRPDGPESGSQNILESPESGGQTFCKVRCPEDEAKHFSKSGVRRPEIFQSQVRGPDAKNVSKSGVRRPEIFESQVRGPDAKNVSKSGVRRPDEIFLKVRGPEGSEAKKNFLGPASGCILKLNVRRPEAKTRSTSAVRRVARTADVRKIGTGLGWDTQREPRMKHSPLTGVLYNGVPL